MNGLCKNRSLITLDLSDCELSEKHGMSLLKVVRMAGSWRDNELY